MCNLYSSTTTQEAMRQLFAVRPEQDHLGNAASQPSIYPKYTAPVVRLTEQGARELVPMHWGFLMPQTSKKTGKPILPKAINNARDDKLQSSSFWRGSFNDRRCLAPASSFAEAKGRNPATYFWFGLTADDPADRPPFAFAAIWRHWRGEIKGEPFEADTYSIITTTPNELVRPFHPDRMPVILAPSDYETWLTGYTDTAADLLKPYPSERMRIVRQGQSATADSLGG
ncbi:SOS response-associated peptidase [uncultured Roseovarius sp.]|uniref:SOS response-associated peptidase n=1 Tax=uncultured Roseovarius sp. TaxID=293344 RepID=UPI002592869A|nr:SOS response-associated peptidase [uncultured Roseovarius sp.]